MPVRPKHTVTFISARRHALPGPAPLRSAPRHGPARRRCRRSALSLSLSLSPPGRRRHLGPVPSAGGRDGDTRPENERKKVPPPANTGKALELLDMFPDVRRENRSAGSIFPVNRQSWKTLLGAGAVLCTSGLCQFPGTSGDLAWLSSQSRYTACLDLCPGAEPRLVNWTGAVSEQLPSVTRE